MLWRHDVDLSVHRAARLAGIEADEGVAATYFFFHHSAFNNLLERPVAGLARQIVGHGAHRLGLHFDTSFYGTIGSVDDLAERIAREAGVLGDLLEVPVEAFSYNPGVVNDDLAFDANQIGGPHNAYGAGHPRPLQLRLRRKRLLPFPAPHRRSIRGHRRLPARSDSSRLVASGTDAASGTDRSMRRGQAVRIMPDYDDVLARIGRQNIR